MKKAIIILWTVVTIGLCGTDSKRGSSGAQELLIPVGTRSTALAGAAIANVVGTEALFWNPAGIALTPKITEIGFFHQTHLGDIQHVFSGMTYNLGDAGTFGIHLKYLDVGKIPVTTVDQPDGTGETYSPSFITYGFSYGRKMTDLIALGVTAKLVTEQVVDASAVGIAFDFGLQYFTGIDGLTFGFVIQNIGPDIQFDGKSLDKGDALHPQRTVIAQDPLPTMLQVGVSYQIPAGEKSSVTLFGKAQNNSFDADQYSAGVEYDFQNRVFLRGGYEFATGAQKDFLGMNSYAYDFSGGTGVIVSPTDDLTILIDYAYRHSQLFNGNHSLSIKLSL